MTEQKKDENCCSGCTGVKKLIVGLILGVLIFVAGYYFAKGQCPFSQRFCPLIQR